MNMREIVDGMDSYARELPASMRALDEAETALGPIPPFLRDFALVSDGGNRRFVFVHPVHNWFRCGDLLVFADYLQWCWAFAVSVGDDANVGRVARVASNDDGWIAGSLDEFFTILVSQPDDVSAHDDIGERIPTPLDRIEVSIEIPPWEWFCRTTP